MSCAVCYFALLSNLIPEYLLGLILLLIHLIIVRFGLAKIFYIADMGILFENPNAKSLYKKWYATNVLPIPTPLQVLSSKIHIRNPHTYL